MSNVAGPIKIILSPENWETKRQEGGEIVAVEIAPRVSIRMLKSEAIARGLYKEGEEGEGGKRGRGKEGKRRKQAANKMRAPAEDKGREEPSDG